MASDDGNAAVTRLPRGGAEIVRPRRVALWLVKLCLIECSEVQAVVFEYAGRKAHWCDVQ